MQWMRLAGSCHSVKNLTISGKVLTAHTDGWLAGHFRSARYAFIYIDREPGSTWARLSAAALLL